MTLLAQAAEVHHAHGGNQIFQGVSFELKSGDRIALVGANGAGKSTLFKIAARLLKPDAGVVTHRRGLTVGYLSQESDLDRAATAWEVVVAAGGDPEAIAGRLSELESRMAEALDDVELEAVLDEHAALLARLEAGEAEETDEPAGARVLRGLGLPEERWRTPVEKLSGGEKKLVALARMLLAEPEMLLLDEPDNHLDEAGKTWLEGYVRGYAGGVGIISHDRWFIDRVANRILDLEDGEIVGYPGNYSTYLREKRERLARESQLRGLREREFKKLKASAEALTQWARQNPKFATRAENMRRKMAEERERLEREAPPVMNRRRIEVEFAADRGSTLVLEATQLAKRFGEREVFQPFDLVIRNGERVGLAGPNGSGKTTLFRMIRGEERPSGGTLRLGPSIVVGYYAQEQETLDRSQTPMELVRKLRPLTEQQALSFLVGFLFDRDDALNRIDNLSGGERARLQIAALILKGANFLLLDEPTNNLDLPSIEELEAALLEFPGAILTISHDRYFLAKVCGRILAIDAGVVRDYAGGFGYFRDHPDKGTVLTAGAAWSVAPATPARQVAAESRPTASVKKFR